MSAWNRFLLAVLLVGVASLTHAGPVRALAGQARAAGASLPSIVTGGDHSCELIGDGGVRCWGRNIEGQLGNGTLGTVVQALPVKVAGLSDAVALAAGQSHTCALKASGSVSCWGVNANGELGDGTRSSRPTPVLVTGLSNAVAIAAGIAHTCALRSDATAVCWGFNGDGRLGNGSVGGTSDLPVAVAGLTGATALAAGGRHTCALRVDGTMSCWGGNSYGQLGDGTTTPRPFRVSVNGISNAVAIAAGGLHTCALSAGIVQCWGYNGGGELGNGTGISSSLPVTVTGEVDAVAIAVAGASSSTCALRSNGTVGCWGNNFNGQLGDGTVTTPRLSPVTVGGLSNVVAIATGSSHSCALQANGGTVCWGANSFGQLGDGSNSPSLGPVATALVRTMSAVALDAGNRHTCALRSDGTGACWGGNDSTQLGRGTADSLTPGPVAALVGAVKLSAGGLHNCSLRSDGTVACWGSNRGGELGRGTFTMAETVGPVGSLSSAVTVAVGASHSCALLANGQVKCWGSFFYSQAGFTPSGLSSQIATPALVPGISNAVALVAGQNHTCALRADGTVACWGRNGLGELGSGSAGADRAMPATVFGLSNVVALAAGGRHTCALLAQGGVRCWGANVDGQLGGGNTVATTALVPVAGITNAVAITSGGPSETGGGYTCALLADGTARCWGANESGQLADGTTVTPRLTPVPVTYLLTLCNPFTNVCSATVRNLGGLVAIEAGLAHACAIQVTGAPSCWGNNVRGQVGDGTFVSPRSRPSEVSSFRFNISPAVALRSPGRVATVTALLNCPEDQQAKVEITLRQGSAVGHGIGMRKCAGGLEEYEFTVPAQGRESFVAGPAEAQAEAIVLDHGTLVDTQTWTRKVTLSISP